MMVIAVLQTNHEEVCDIHPSEPLLEPCDGSRVRRSMKARKRGGDTMPFTSIYTTFAVSLPSGLAA
jgi:hypothetical protein